MPPKPLDSWTRADWQARFAASARGTPGAQAPRHNPDAPCRHDPGDGQTIASACCGTVREFLCPQLARKVWHTKCRTCPGYETHPEPRPKLSVCINSHNEGPRLRATVTAFRDHLQDWPHEFVVVADEITDGGGDDLGPNVTVIRNARRRGCGRCKQQAIAAATGDVLLFLDAHMCVMSGSVADMARRAWQEEAIWTPVVRNLRYRADWMWEAVGRRNQVPAEAGMRMEKKQYTVQPNAWTREHHGADIRMVGVGFAVRRATLERIGGVNGYLGLHGSQERGIALRAYMAGVPVKLDSTVVLGHEFRRGRPLPRGFRRWTVTDQAMNFWQAYYVVAGDAAFEQFRPLLHRRARGGESVVNDPGVKAERQHFLEHCRRRSDEDLLTVLGVRPAAVAATSEPPRVSSLPGLLGAVKAGDLPAPVVERWKRAATWHAGVVQHPGELAVVFQRLQADPPKRLLEVGSEGGGSLYIYAGACAPGARLVAVDDGRHAGRAATLERTIAALRAEGFEVHWIRGDSHAAATRKQAVDALSGAPDFVHIDGDHRTAGALQDWRDYGALARAGGLVALHDIDYPRGGVGAAWREIAASGFAVETIKLGVVGGHAPMGVGLVRMAAPLPREPKIDVRIAYEPGGRIGADYNRIMRETPHEWVLLLDHDVLLLHPSWYEVCQRAVREHPDAGLLTCWTNNIACKHQLDAGAPRTADLAAHRARARELWLQHQFACTLNAKWLISGFFMLTCKRAWTKAGGFPEDGFFGVDNEYDRRVRHAGFTTYRIDGLYCYHIRERRDRDWIAGVPTSATLASQRTAVEISRSTAPIGVPA